MYKNLITFLICLPVVIFSQTMNQNMDNIFKESTIASEDTIIITGVMKANDGTFEWNFRPRYSYFTMIMPATPFTSKQLYYTPTDSAKVKYDAAFLLQQLMYVTDTFENVKNYYIDIYKNDTKFTKELISKAIDENGHQGWLYCYERNSGGSASIRYARIFYVGQIAYTIQCLIPKTQYEDPVIQQLMLEILNEIFLYEDSNPEKSLPGSIHSISEIAGASATEFTIDPLQAINLHKSNKKQDDNSFVNVSITNDEGNFIWPVEPQFFYRSYYTKADNFGSPLMNNNILVQPLDDASYCNPFLYIHKPMANVQFYRDFMITEVFNSAWVEKVLINEEKTLIIKNDVELKYLEYAFEFISESGKTFILYCQIYFFDETGFVLGYLTEKTLYDDTALREGFMNIITSITFAPQQSSSIENPIQPSLKSFILGNNYPNPFNANTVIPFDLKQGDHIQIKLFNLQGQCIQILANDFYPAGHHEITLELNNIPTGPYLYQIQNNTALSQKKLLLVK